MVIVKLNFFLVFCNKNFICNDLALNHHMTRFYGCKWRGRACYFQEIRLATVIFKNYGLKFGAVELWNTRTTLPKMSVFRSFLSELFAGRLC